MEKDLAVITTRYLLQKNSPILNVCRDSDGEWQFLDAEDVTEEDARVVSLLQIMDLDDSIREVLNIERDHMACRNHIVDKWKIAKS